MGAVTAFQFGIGNGVATAFNIMDPSGSIAVAPSVTSLYKNDWGGKQLLYTTARTNNAFRSDQVNLWNLGDVSSTTNTIVGPDGVTSAEEVIEAATTAVHYAGAINTILVDSTTYCASIYVKRVVGTRDAFFYTYNKAGTQIGIHVNLTTGIITSTTATVPSDSGVQTLTNGWYRLWFAFPTTTGATPPAPVCMFENSGQVSYLGDGVSSLGITGIQVEVGSAPTTLITNTNASPTTASNTDYSVTGAVVTLSPAPVNRACLSWTGTDSNAAFNPAYGNEAATSSFGCLGVR